MAYTPTPNITSSPFLAHLQTLYYEKTALSILRTMFRFGEHAEQFSLPKGVGKTLQLYRYTNLPANTTAKSPEGSVGTSINLPASKTVQITVSQYTDYITISDFLMDTANDPILSNASDALGYRAGLTVDTLTRTVLDNEAASMNLSLLAATFKVADLRNGWAQLQGINVPYPDGKNVYPVLIHPYVAFDIINDPSVVGLADTFKYTDPTKAALVTSPDRGQLAVAGNASITISTNVATIAGSPNKWRVYMFGKEAYGVADLSGRGPSKVVDPNKEKFKIKVWKNDGMNAGPADPEGVIGGFVSYNFFYGCAMLEGPAGIGGQYRARTWDAPSSIVS